MMVDLEIYYATESTLCSTIMYLKIKDVYEGTSPKGLLEKLKLKMSEIVTCVIMIMTFKTSSFPLCLPALLDDMYIDIL